MKPNPSLKDLVYREIRASQEKHEVMLRLGPKQIYSLVSMRGIISDALAHLQPGEYSMAERLIHQVQAALKPLEQGAFAAAIRGELGNLAADIKTLAFAKRLNPASALLAGAKEKVQTPVAVGTYENWQLACKQLDLAQVCEKLEIVCKVTNPEEAKSVFQKIWQERDAELVGTDLHYSRDPDSISNTLLVEMAAQLFDLHTMGELVQFLYPSVQNTFEPARQGSKLALEYKPVSNAGYGTSNDPITAHKLSSLIVLGNVAQFADDFSSIPQALEKKQLAANFWLPMLSDAPGLKEMLEASNPSLAISTEPPSGPVTPTLKQMLEILKRAFQDFGAGGQGTSANAASGAYLALENFSRDWALFANLQNEPTGKEINHVLQTVRTGYRDATGCVMVAAHNLSGIMSRADPAILNSTRPRPSKETSASMPKGLERTFMPLLPTRLAEQSIPPILDLDTLLPYLLEMPPSCYQILLRNLDSRYLFQADRYGNILADNQRLALHAAIFDIQLETLDTSDWQVSAAQLIRIASAEMLPLVFEKLLQKMKSDSFETGDTAFASLRLIQTLLAKLTPHDQLPILLRAKDATLPFLKGPRGKEFAGVLLSLMPPEHRLPLFEQLIDWIDQEHPVDSLKLFKIIHRHREVLLPNEQKAAGNRVRDKLLPFLYGPNAVQFAKDIEQIAPRDEQLPLFDRLYQIFLEAQSSHNHPDELHALARLLLNRSSVGDQMRRDSVAFITKSIVNLLTQGTEVLNSNYEFYHDLISDITLFQEAEAEELFENLSKTLSVAQLNSLASDIAEIITISTPAELAAILWDFAFPILLAKALRENSLAPLRQLVANLTEQPASVYGNNSAAIVGEMQIARLQKICQGLLHYPQILMELLGGEMTRYGENQRVPHTLVSMREGSLFADMCESIGRDPRLQNQLEAMLAEVPHSHYSTRAHISLLTQALAIPNAASLRALIKLYGKERIRFQILEFNRTDKLESLATQNPSAEYCRVITELFHEYPNFADLTVGQRCSLFAFAKDDVSFQRTLLGLPKEPRPRTGLSNLVYKLKTNTPVKLIQRYRAESDARFISKHGDAWNLQTDSPSTYMAALRAIDRGRDRSHTGTLLHLAFSPSQRSNETAILQVIELLKNDPTTLEELLTTGDANGSKPLDRAWDRSVFSPNVINRLSEILPKQQMQRWFRGK